MPRIFSITNDNKQVEKKANFFSEWFHLYTTNLGINHLFELENPLSLIDKIIYQLENNSLDYAFPYLKNYFSHEYFINDMFLDTFLTYGPVSKKVRSFCVLSKVGEFKTWYSENGDVLDFIEGISK
ncbi:hypothetical protein [Chitinophaga filiformis]|uniref:Uncharacterized protein n=1 Tax=Chitinophaga filiformis TaxID=104663 RepID=A0A1G7SLH3_CHIFI|nr:hypothetical protein [Chitinophaga filiformis]SDG23937.1 hypothetical protein SAMN04488121_103924 [Chitinophaga filiformis]